MIAAMRCKTIPTAHAAIGFLSMHFPDVKFTYWASYRWDDSNKIDFVDVNYADSETDKDERRDRIFFGFACYVAGRGEL